VKYTFNALIDHISWIKPLKFEKEKRKEKKRRKPA
jgi:hypothetical protein